MDNGEEDVCLLTHGPEVASDVVQERRTAFEVIDVRLNYLVDGLDKHYSVAEVFEAGLDRQLGIVPQLARVAEWLPLAALAMA